MANDRAPAAAPRPCRRSIAEAAEAYEVEAVADAAAEQLDDDEENAVSEAASLPASAAKLREGAAIREK